MYRLLAVLLGVILSVVVVAVAIAAPPLRAIPVIGIQTIHLDGAFVWSEDPATMSAFVETGSLDAQCLATLHESNAADAVKTIWCASRQIERDGRLMNGLFIHIFFDGLVPEGATVDVNYYQQRMVTNPPAIPCDGSC